MNIPLMWSSFEYWPSIFRGVGHIANDMVTLAMERKRYEKLQMIHG
jgi:hypothetical protein